MIDTKENYDSWKLQAPPDHEDLYTQEGSIEFYIEDSKETFDEVFKKALKFITSYIRLEVIDNPITINILELYKGKPIRYSIIFNLEYETYDEEYSKEVKFEIEQSLKQAGFEDGEWLNN